MDDLYGETQLSDSKKKLAVSNRELKGLIDFFEDRIGVHLPNFDPVIEKLNASLLYEKSIEMVDKVALSLGRYISNPDVSYGIEQLVSDLKKNISSENLNIDNVIKSFDDSAKRVESLGRSGWVPEFSMSDGTISLGIIGKSGVNKTIANFDASVVSRANLNIDVAFHSDNGFLEEFKVPVEAFRIDNMKMSAPDMSPEYREQLKAGLGVLVVTDINLPEGLTSEGKEVAYSQISSSLMNLSDTNVVSLSNADYGDISLKTPKTISASLEENAPELMRQVSHQLGRSIIDAPALKRIVKNGAEMSEQGQDADFVMWVLEKQLKDNGIDLTANQLASLKESVEGMTSGNISPSDIQGTVSRIVTLRDQQLKLVLEKPEKKIENKVEDMDLALSPPRLTPG
jgi:hypothetical protein|tara:strand:+ start:1386 stop:2582 length:1197 start_codon:yes stop_codon:yes gene_type:complete